MPATGTQASTPSSPSPQGPMPITRSESRRMRSALRQATWARSRSASMGFQMGWNGRGSTVAPRGGALTGRMRLFQTALLVSDYDDAIAFYVGKVGFDLVQDTDMGGGKRWVVVRPPGSDAP